MHRLPIFLSLVIMLAALVIRKVKADRALHKARGVRLSMSAEVLARKMLDSLGHEGIEIEVATRANRVWAGADVIGHAKLRMSEEIGRNFSAYANGRAALYVGLYLLSLRDSKAMDRRRWALRFGNVFPIFTTMVIAFALIVRMPILWGLAAVMSSLALATCTQILTLHVERQAAELACVVIKKKRTLPRLSDEESLIESTRAWSWHGILPGILDRLT